MHFKKTAIVYLPIPNAKQLVKDVIVMATPAFLIAKPIWVARSLSLFSDFKESKLWTMTNISSIPMPSNINGSMECIGVYG